MFPANLHISDAPHPSDSPNLTLTQDNAPLPDSHVRYWAACLHCHHMSHNKLHCHHYITQNAIFPPLATPSATAWDPPALPVTTHLLPDGPHLLRNPPLLLLNTTLITLSEATPRAFIIRNPKGLLCTPNHVLSPPSTCWIYMTSPPIPHSL